VAFDVIGRTVQTASRIGRRGSLRRLVTAPLPGGRAGAVDAWPARSSMRGGIPAISHPRISTTGRRRNQTSRWPMRTASWDARCGATSGSWRHRFSLGGWNV